jgi:hypothetical protein
MFLFGIPFFGFALFWESTALVAITAPARSSSGHAPPAAFLYFFPLFGIPFLLVGLSMLLSPLGYRKKAARTAYAVTDRRAIVINGKLLAGREVRSYSPVQLGAISRTERANGCGDLVFQEEIARVHWRGGRGPSTVPIGFLGIAEVRAVEKILKETLLVGETALRADV